MEKYNDGFTMEEQEELARQYRIRKKMEKIQNISSICLVPEKVKLQQADKLISSLRVSLAQEKAYTEELEDTVKDLKTQIHDAEIAIIKEHNQVEELKTRLKQILDKYSSDMQIIISSDSLYQLQEQKHKEKCKELEAEIEKIKISRDLYLSELIKYRENERNFKTLV